MAQFDVHRNPGPHQDTIPMVVIIQSAAFDDYARRVVVPLVRKSALPEIINPRFNPVFEIEGDALVLHPLDLVSVSRTQLGPFVTNLSHEGQRIRDALDDLLTCVWS